MTWQNQVALVTGASRGIGRAIAQALAAKGAAVAVNYAARADEADAVVAGIVASGGRAVALQADVGDDAAVTRLVAEAERALGPVSILVNNAGIAISGSLDEYDPEAFARMQRVNVDGVIHTIRATMAGMRARHYGRIVNISSIAAAGTSLPGNAFYGATKASVSILTRRFAMELGADGITVNAVAPGFIMTDLTRRRDNWQEIVARVSAISMMARAGQPEDIAHAVAFLADPAAGFVTAQVVTVDGGRMDYTGHV